MQAPNSPEGGVHKPRVSIPGDMTWADAWNYADDLIKGLETDESDEPFVSPGIAEAAQEFAETPDDYVDELFHLGIQESKRRMEKMGQPRIPGQETITPLHEASAAHKPERKQRLQQAAVTCGSLMFLASGYLFMRTNPDIPQWITEKYQALTNLRM